MTASPGTEPARGGLVTRTNQPLVSESGCALTLPPSMLRPKESGYVMAARHASPATAGGRGRPTPGRYPLEPHRRAGARRELRNMVMADAERRVLEVGRSIKCAGWGGIAPPRHVGDPDGCRNDGTNCICECHDLEVYAVLDRLDNAQDEEVPNGAEG